MFISLDLETTGFDPKKDKIIEFGATKFNLDGTQESLQFLCNPGIQIPDIVTHITNIRNEDLKNEGPFSDKVEEVQQFIGDLPIIGHNIQFDTGFLRENGIKIENPEYDTHDLAAMLLPGMQSYSLEILSKVLGLEHKEKHRALDDAIAAMELFIILSKKFQSLPKELINNCHSLLEKSQWALKKHLLSLEHLSETENTIEINKEEKFLEEESQALKVEQLEENSAIQIIPPYHKTIKELSEKLSDDSYISIPNHLFYELEDEISDDIAKIDCYDHYLSIDRLEKFCQKEQFENEEISALLKIIIWADQTKTGLLREVRLKGEELKIFAHICVNPDNPKLEEEPFIKRALDKDKTSAAICSHSYLIEHPPEESKLIIFNFQALHDRLHRRRSTFLNLEMCERPLEVLKETQSVESLNILIEKTRTLFALIESIFEKHNDANIYAPRCIINEEVLSLGEWRNCQESIKGLVEISSELANLKNTDNLPQLRKWKEILQKLNSVFNKSQFNKNFIFLEKDRKGNVVVREIPFSVDEELRTILNKNHSFKIVDENFLNLPEEIRSAQAKQNLENVEINIIENMDEKKKFQKIEFIQTNSQASKKAIILNSKKELEFYTLELQKRGFNTVSQLTASTGKLEALFNNTENPLLLVTPNMWNKLGCLREIEEVFIAKIPFEPPSDAFLVAQSKNYGNPFEELSIPRSIASLKRCINRLAFPANINRQVFLLDPRLTQKSYGKSIVEKLKESYLVK